MASNPIDKAVNYLQQGGKKPDSQSVVAALLAAEKQNRKEKIQYAYDDLIGSWRLGFVSGTKTVSSGSGASPTKKPGKGRFLPSFLKVEIAYKERNCDEAQHLDQQKAVEPNVRSSLVENSVTIGPLQLSLSGPTLFKPKPNALAFDFTKIAVSLGRWRPYKGDIRGGDKSAQAFESRSLKDQAFFTFFLVEDNYIAARGKGGGLALWTRSKTKRDQAR